MSKIYTENSIPIIVAYTQALKSGYTENMEKIIKEKNYDFIPVWALKVKVAQFVVEPFGIKKLKKISVKRARDAVKFPNYENYIIQATKEIESTKWAISFINWQEGKDKIRYYERRKKWGRNM